MNEIIKYHKYESPKEYRKAILPAVTGILGDNERAIVSASTEPSIRDLDSVEMTKQLRDAMRWIVRDIGYRYSSPEDEQYIVVRFASVLSKYYGGLSIKDVKLAFEMLAVGELDGLIKAEDRKHYGQISMDYLCRVLNAYKVKRSAAINKAYDNAPKEEKSDWEEDKRLEALNRQRLIDAVLYFKYHNTIRPTNPIQEMIFCKILEDVGLLEVTDEPDEGLIIDAVVGKVGKYRKPLERAFRYITENEIQIKTYIK